MSNINVTVYDYNINNVNEEVNINITTETQWPAWPAWPTGWNYVHDQNSASDTWSITHNLGFMPNITVVDTAGNTLIGFGIQYVNINSLIISLAGATTGVAYLS